MSIVLCWALRTLRRWSLVSRQKSRLSTAGTPHDLGKMLPNCSSYSLRVLLNQAYRRSVWRSSAAGLPGPKMPVYGPSFERENQMSNSSFALGPRACMTRQPSRSMATMSSRPTDGFGPYDWNSERICDCSLERSFTIFVLRLAILGMWLKSAKSLKSISTAPRRFATSLYCFFSLMYMSMSTAWTSMCSFISALIVVVRCVFAWSRLLISLQISCTIRSDFSALSLIALILSNRAPIECLASPTACFVCTLCTL
mmetsp:Transcript_27711/g.53902  ORF Transcript_27711/g.53902 Transcript_27711/m.53902 type:complete len:255 (+) Transcript_27711:1552-2316(+)